MCISFILSLLSVPFHPQEQTTLYAATCCFSCCYVCLALARLHFKATYLSNSPCFSLKGAKRHNKLLNISIHVSSYYSSACYPVHQGHTLKHKLKTQRLRPFKAFF